MRSGRKWKRSAMLRAQKGTGAGETKRGLWRSLRLSALNSGKRRLGTLGRYVGGKSRSRAAKRSARLHALNWTKCGRKRRGSWLNLRESALNFEKERLSALKRYAGGKRSSRAAKKSAIPYGSI